jgi:ferrochelatase
MTNAVIYFVTFLALFAVNVPLGYWLLGTQKFSDRWLTVMGASALLLIYLNSNLPSPWAGLIVSVIVSAIGQNTGRSLRQQSMTVDEREELAQIPNLRLDKAGALDTRDVTVVLLNMGGPKTNADVKDFLHRIFLDPLILRFPLSKLLQPFFAWLIVTLRWKVTAERYQKIGGGSPIYSSTQAQVMALRDELKRRGRNLDVTYCFNYSEPLPATVLKEMAAQKKKYLLPLSLYPHYSKATTGSNLAYLKMAAAEILPKLKFLPVADYSLHPDYVKALADRVREQVKEGESLEDFYLLFSPHGLPQYFLNEGDPYPFLISQTAAAVLVELNRHDRWSLAYQSDVGPVEWLKPSTGNMISALARRGVKKLIVIPIAFVSDHIETLCEIDIEYRHQAETEGIADFRMSRAVETHPGFISALADTVERLLPADTDSNRILSTIT